MLALTCERAGLADGRTILELGCGWGSLTLWLAERYPEAHIIAVSNSRAQRDCIEAAARTAASRTSRSSRADMNDLELERRFDRVVSVEMFEHMRNYEALLAPDRVAGSSPTARLFVHVFCHRELAYPYDATGWMARELLHRRARCRRPTCCSSSSATSRSSSAGRFGRALRPHGRGLARAAGRERGGDRASLGQSVSRALARVLPRVRRALRLPRRHRVARRALPLRAARRELTTPSRRRRRRSRHGPAGRASLPRARRRRSPRRRPSRG